jgi:hypothetical protein
MMDCKRGRHGNTQELDTREMDVDMGDDKTAIMVRTNMYHSYAYGI